MTALYRSDRSVSHNSGRWQLPVHWPNCSNDTMQGSDPTCSLLVLSGSFRSHFGKLATVLFKATILLATLYRTAISRKVRCGFCKKIDPLHDRPIRAFRNFTLRTNNVRCTHRNFTVRRQTHALMFQLNTMHSTICGVCACAAILPGQVLQHSGVSLELRTLLGTAQLQLFPEIHQADARPVQCIVRRNVFCRTCFNGWTQPCTNEARAL